jgi:excisionase family DNA binding protein
MPSVVENVFDVNEAAEKLGISYATVYRWIKAGKITPVRIFGRTLIPITEITRIKNDPDHEKIKAAK